MKISNLQIENFRNILRADVQFGRINIFTGKNASGKSNFLLALSNSLKVATDFSDVFFDNIVTFGQGKNKTVFRPTIDDLGSQYLYVEEGYYLYFKPEKFTFENTLGKKTSSALSHKLFYTGSFSKDPVASIAASSERPNIVQNIQASKNLQRKENELVYSKAFFKDQIEGSGAEQYIKIDETEAIENSQKYLSIFSGYKNAVMSWVDPRMFSSTKIYLHVVDRYDSEVYEQVLLRLKEKNDPTHPITKSPFQKAKFIALLADIQRNDKQREQFVKDLNLYTKGLVEDMAINVVGGVGNKGEIVVTSSNAQKDILYISAGTAVMVYLILVKNWVQLPFADQSFERPHVMTFDEVDSIIHPSLMHEFKEVLKGLSKFVQLFISTHSSHFIDCFEKNEVFWLKDTISVVEKKKLNDSSSIYSYAEILARMPKDSSYFTNRLNSELFIDGMMDDLFPLI
jgi:AAA15 family ATPase/GTPase